MFVQLSSLSIADVAAAIIFIILIAFTTVHYSSLSISLCNISVFIFCNYFVNYTVISKKSSSLCHISPNIMYVCYIQKGT